MKPCSARQLGAVGLPLEEKAFIPVFNGQIGQNFPAG